MTKQEFKQLAKQKIIILDGATGSNLQEKGMKAGVCPELFMLEHKEMLIELQKEYLQAGTDILYAPTFTANRIKLREYGLEERTFEINKALVELSRQATKGFTLRSVYIAGDLTMTGCQVYPNGTLQFEELVVIYKEQITALVAAGVDLLIIETMMSLQECRAAVLAAKEVCELPIMVTLTFEKNGRTLFGTDPKTAVIVLQSLGVDAIGMNCSTGPESMIDMVCEMKKYANIPIIAKPNAGIPKLIDNKTMYSMGADEFSKKCKSLIKKGVGIVGGCCGTTKEHIKALAKIATDLPVPEISTKKIRALSTEHRTTEIGLDGKLMIVGERINPTGKKALQAELVDGKFDLVCAMAEEQEMQGADIFDINMGMNGIDEKDRMVNGIYEVLSQVDLPLSIDSSDVDVIEAALRIYSGRALINSISLETRKLKPLIALAKKYGAMFILLPLSDEGLPKDINEKKEIIQTIMDVGKEAGLDKEDIIVDGLVNTIGANKEAAIQTLETIRFCKEELGVATICGLSNISFGLPERGFLNATFLALAVKEGLTMAIANPSSDLLINTAFAADLLCHKEDSDIRYIERISRWSVEKSNVVPLQSNVASLQSNVIYVQNNETILQSSNTIQNETIANQKIEKECLIYNAIVKGNRKKILDYVKEELNNNSKPSEIVSERLIPAINHVGKLFEEKRYFLPQLIASAETMKLAIEYLEPMLSSFENTKNLGVVVIATVQGDIHDIGKNLVALMLKNYGFRVIDLGKDVKSECIIQSAIEHNADIIALSALMTTTMVEMKRVVQLRNEANISTKIMIGGAVITKSYCDEIGADGFSSNAQEAVSVAKKLVGVLS